MNTRGMKSEIKLIVSQYENTQWQKVMKSEIGEELMKLAAFATIGDVMELRDENRIIVKKGLSLISNTKNRGLKALMNVTGTNPANVSPYTVGFVLGPCLNATGRLENAKLAVELLLEKNYDKAIELLKTAKDILTENNEYSEIRQFRYEYNIMLIAIAQNKEKTTIMGKR